MAARIVALSLLFLVAAPFAFAENPTKDDHLLATKMGDSINDDKNAEDANLMSYGYGGFGRRFGGYGGYGYGGYRPYRYGYRSYGHGHRGYHLLSDEDRAELAANDHSKAELMSVEGDNKAELMSHHGYGGYRHGGYRGYGHGFSRRRSGYGGHGRGFGRRRFSHGGYHLLSDNDATQLEATEDNKAELMSADDAKVNGGDNNAELMSYGYGGYRGYGYGGYRPYGYGYRSYGFGHRYGGYGYGGYRFRRRFRRGYHLLEDENDA